MQNDALITSRCRQPWPLGYIPLRGDSSGALVDVKVYRIPVQLAWVTNNVRSSRSRSDTVQRSDTSGSTFAFTIKRFLSKQMKVIVTDASDTSCHI